MAIKATMESQTAPTIRRQPNLAGALNSRHLHRLRNPYPGPTTCYFLDNTAHLR